MKQVLIVVAHPSQKSFNYSLYEEIVWFCRSNRFHYQTIDLYREDFDPIIRDVEPSINKRMVENYQSMVLQSDLVVFISPLWWYRCTTMLEGFFDKVFTQGFAFESGSSIFLKPLLSNKVVVCFLSTGSTHWLKRVIQKTIATLRLKFGVLNSCFGFKNSIYFCDVGDKQNNQIAFEKDRAIYLLKKKF